MTSYSKEQSSRAQKVAARLLVIDCIKKTFKNKIPLRSISLPSDNFLYERELMDIDNRNFIHTAEKELDTFRRGRDYIYEEKLDIKHYYGDIFDVIRKYKYAKYNAIWLDLCSCLSPTVWNNVIEVVQSPSLDKECIFALTFLRAREHKDNITQIKSQFGDITLEEFRDSLETNIISFANDVNRSASLLYKYDYGTKKECSPMSVLIFHLKKNKNEQIN